MSELGVPLSILDVAPVGEGSSPAVAVRSSLDLVQRVEQLGYRRFWVAEHHNVAGIASSSPAVLLAHLASVTSTIRLGAGGVILPNHSSLIVAEQFGMLEALHPGRIDLGIGRGPGADPVTVQALRPSTRPESPDDFPRQLDELLGFFNGFPDDHPYRHVTAVPGLGDQPALWLLGSSDSSARVAGSRGLPFSFAHHLAAGSTDAAVEAYRASFRPVGPLEEPHLMVSVVVVCAETVERARWLAGPARLGILWLRAGRPFPTPEEAAAHEVTSDERQLVEARASSYVIGDPGSVRRRLAELVERTGADEVIVLTMTHDPADRTRSYELLAQTAGLTPNGQVTTPAAAK